MVSVQNLETSQRSLRVHPSCDHHVPSQNHTNASPSTHTPPPRPRLDAMPYGNQYMDMLAPVSLAPHPRPQNAVAMTYPHLIDWSPSCKLDGTPLPKRGGFSVLFPGYELSRAGVPDVRQAVPATPEQEPLVGTERQVANSLHISDGRQGRGNIKHNHLLPPSTLTNAGDWGGGGGGVSRTFYVLTSAQHVFIVGYPIKGRSGGGGA